MTEAPEKKSKIETVQLPPERARPTFESLDAEVLRRATSAMQTEFDKLLEEDAELARIFSKIVEAKAKVAVFGGWARDRLFEVIHGQTALSRDIDFVVSSPQPIASFFPAGAKTNPFGGVGIIGARVPLEAWSLKETFLFRLRDEEATFEALPATADYDVNAILFFPAQCNGHASVLDGGAGHALKLRKIDFMADVVAQPKIQAARAVILATRLDLQPSEAVCDFVQDICEKRETAREVECALDLYSPYNMKERARDLLERIRQGGSGGRPKSEFFVHCWGVFEGGGVRAAAHAGGFAAAKRAGITFGKVAGTSGGSIVAALVAAGATPGYLRQHLLNLDFLPLLDQPNKEDIFFTKRLPLWARMLRLLTWGRLRTLANIAKYGGLHNSASLGNWIESRLVELVRTKGSSSKVPVLFSELPIPLHVVATDFSTGKPKIWSPETTGDESVALAVRHSCTIPMFFQPAPSGSSIFFDGGAVSNLPAYVLNKQKGSNDERDVLPRILAFRLIADAKGSRSVPDLSDFIKRLADTVIDSASEIQLQLQPNVYPINIETGAIQSTDFGKVDEEAKRFLYGRGVRSVRNFIEGERLNALHGDIAAHEFQGFDEKMLLLVRQMPSCQHTLLAMGPDTYWLDYVFPSLLLLLRRGVAVTAVVPQGDGMESDREEQRRRQLLELLGVSVTEAVHDLPFVGFAFDLGTDRACTILTYLPADRSQTTRYTHEKVRFYTADSDPVVLGMMTEQVCSYTANARSSPLALHYAASAPQKLIQRLQTIPVYKSASVRLQRISVDQQIVVMHRRVKEFKALQTRLFMSDLVKHGRRLFGHIEVQLAGTASTIVTPPVLERHAGFLVVIDGSARLHHCLSNGIEEVEAVVIENVVEPLPSDGRFPLGNLRLVSSTVPIPKNYQNYRASAYRPIESAVHQNYD